MSSCVNLFGCTKQTGAPVSYTEDPVSVDTDACLIVDWPKEQYTKVFNKGEVPVR